MKTSYLLSFFLDTLKRDSRVSQNLVKNNGLIGALEDQIISLAVRILGGLVLTGVIIFSLVKIGMRADELILTNEGGIYLSLAVFSVLTIVCGLALFMLFKQKRKIETPAQTGLGIDPTNILVKFTEGLAEGMEKSAQKRQDVKEYVASKPDLVADVDPAPSIMRESMAGGLYARPM